MSRNSTRHYTHSAGDWLELEVGYRVLNYGCAERISGPPEHCWPAEPAEIEIVSAAITAPGQADLQIPLAYLPEGMLDALQDECCEHASEQEQAQREAEAEARWDAQREEA